MTLSFELGLVIIEMSHHCIPAVQEIQQKQKFWLIFHRTLCLTAMCHGSLRLCDAAKAGVSRKLSLILTMSHNLLTHAVSLPCPELG